MQEKKGKNAVKVLTGTLVLFLLAINFVVLRSTLSQAASSNSYQVKISYETINVNSSEKNKIRVYYMDGTSWGGYSFDKHYKDIPCAAKRCGEFDATFNLPGPVQSVEIYVYGSALDSVESYLTSIDFTNLNPIDGCEIPKTINLWSGKLGCKVGTVAGNTVYSKVYLNNFPENIKSNVPYIQEWRDPGTEKKALFGDDYVNFTSGYYEYACMDPKPFGMTQCSCATEMNVPTQGINDKTGVSIYEGVLYDQYGVPWPDQDGARIHHTPSDIGRDSYQTFFLYSYNNRKSDYTMTLTLDHHGIMSDEFKVLCHTFDYNFTFKDQNGEVIEEKTVDYGDPIEPPLVNNRKSKWYCDEYSSWENTKDGPQNRTVYRVNLEGSGTENDPLLIKSEEDWKTLCSVFYHSNLKSDTYVRLENDISVSDMMLKDDKRFCMNFDGNGHTITVDFKNDINGLPEALFPYFGGSSDNTTVIKNLTVAGSITGEANDAAGIIGYSYDNVMIDNCIVSATISGKDSIAGLVYCANGNQTIQNSQFIGKINGRNGCAGMIKDHSNSGWVKLYEDGVYIQDGSGCSEGKTFICRESYSSRNIVYSKPFGVPQGKQVDYTPTSQAEVEKKATKYQQSVMSAVNKKVTGLKAKVQGKKKVNISWKNLKSAVKLTIKYSTDKNMKKNVKTKTVKLPLKNKTIKNLKKGTLRTEK